MVVIPEIVVGADRAILGDSDVVTAANDLATSGATVLQLRDLAGDIATNPRRAEWVRELMRTLHVPLRYSGGIDNSQGLDRVSRMGFASVVVGSQAAFDPAFLRWALDMVGSRLIVELQAQREELWPAPAASHAEPLVEIVRGLQAQGVQHVMYRDISGDEISPAIVRDLCLAATIDISCAGTVNSIAALRELAGLRLGNLAGIVIGDALQDGSIDLAEAQRAVA